MLGLFIVRIIANLRSHPKMSEWMKHYFGCSTMRPGFWSGAGLILHEVKDGVPGILARTWY